MSSTEGRAAVVVAVADEHDAALRYAAAEAVRDWRSLRVVHVVHPPRGLAGPEAILISFQAVELVAEQLLRHQYERALELVDGRVPVEPVLRRGVVVDMLLEQCGDADHIVLQQRHAPRLDRILTGSTAAALAARSPVPVVSVPELWPGPHASPRVTVGVGDRDVGDHDENLLARAFFEAEARRASLTVLHAWYLPPDYGPVDAPGSVVDGWQEATRRQVEAHVAPWRRAHSGVEVRVDVPHMRPVDALVAASGHSDVLLVGRRRSHGVVHLGSIVRAAVRECRCPLVVVTPDSRIPGGRPARPDDDVGLRR